MRSSSIFQGDALVERYREIRDIYLADNRPWVVGYSGGKDSTCALQMVWSALADLPPERRQKPVYVISSDTLVETPVIVRYIDATLDRVSQVALKQGLPFRTEKVTPRTDRSFWVNLIGAAIPLLREDLGGALSG